MLQALIFDVDGTLADTERDGHRVAFNAAFREAGLDWEWNEALYGELLAVTGGKERISYFVALYRPEFARLPDFKERVAMLHQTKTRHYTALLATGAIPLRPGVARLLDEARAAGLRLAIATTTAPENVTALLVPALGTEAMSWFETVGAGDIVPAKKPAPNIYQWVLERLGLPASDCLAFEDSENGLRAALGAGLATVVTPCGYTRGQSFAGAVAVLDSLENAALPNLKTWLDTYHTETSFSATGSPMSQTVYESRIASLPLIARGKVRDIYAVGDQQMLIVTTDRLSAFDVILPDPIPDKGRVLVSVSNFWFGRLAHIVPNHLTGIDPESVVKGDEERAQVRGRSVVVKRLKPLPVEAVVRGYIIGSGWKDYQKTGAICGIPLPPGLKLAQKLPQPLFTPSTKAAMGTHDENIDFATVEKTLGASLAAQVRDATLRFYSEASAYALTRGIIVADTKFEFGLDAAGTLHLIDEALTPDSSRFWAAGQYQEGISPPSFDKQIVRDYLETLDWNKQAPGPKLPAEIVAKTSAKYREAYERLTGKSLD